MVVPRRQCTPAERFRIDAQIERIIKDNESSTRLFDANWDMSRKPKHLYDRWVKRAVALQDSLESSDSEAETDSAESTDIEGTHLTSSDLKPSSSRRQRKSQFRRLPFHFSTELRDEDARSQSIALTKEEEAKMQSEEYTRTDEAFASWKPRLFGRWRFLNKQLAELEQMKIDMNKEIETKMRAIDAKEESIRDQKIKLPLMYEQLYRKTGTFRKEAKESQRRYDLMKAINPAGPSTDQEVIKDDDEKIAVPAKSGPKVPRKSWYQGIVDQSIDPKASAEQFGRIEDLTQDYIKNGRKLPEHAQKKPPEKRLTKRKRADRKEVPDAATGMILTDNVAEKLLETPFHFLPSYERARLSGAGNIVIPDFRPESARGRPDITPEHPGKPFFRFGDPRFGDPRFEQGQPEDEIQPVKDDPEDEEPVRGRSMTRTYGRPSLTGEPSLTEGPSTKNGAKRVKLNRGRKPRQNDFV